jgi:glutaredoxin
VALMLLGGAGLVLGALSLMGMFLPLPLPQPLWLGLSAVALVTGAGFTWSGDHPRTEWKPTRPGRRFQSAVLYTRRDCPLCDEARSTLSQYSVYLPALIEVDIDEDAELRERFTTCIPVVELDNQVRFRGRVNEALLRRLIEGARPIE